MMGHYRLPLQGAESAADVMATELITSGPMTVDFCVRDNFFSFWTVDARRIYTDDDGCRHGPSVGGHMAMLIGFGVRSQDGRDLSTWYLQNSWSDAWGDSGYFY